MPRALEQEFRRQEEQRERTMARKLAEVTALESALKHRSAPLFSTFPHADAGVCMLCVCARMHARACVRAVAWRLRVCPTEGNGQGAIESTERGDRLPGAVTGGCACCLRRMQRSVRSLHELERRERRLEIAEEEAQARRRSENAQIEQKRAEVSVV